MGALLEVAIAHERDVPGALSGGADRLRVAARSGDGHGLSPEITTVSAVCREADVPVFVLLRLTESWSTTGAELARLVGLAEDYLAVGASGVCFGFLDGDLQIDTEVCGHLAAALENVPWVFTEAIDDTLDPRRAWRAALGLPGLLNVCSAGSPRGMREGYDDLLAAVESDRAMAARLMPRGGVSPEHVPWLVRAGVGAFHLDEEVRPGGSRKAYVDAALTRSWRLLLDRVP